MRVIETRRRTWSDAAGGANFAERVVIDDRTVQELTGYNRQERLPDKRLRTVVKESSASDWGWVIAAIIFGMFTGGFAALWFLLLFYAVRWVLRKLFR